MERTSRNQAGTPMISKRFSLVGGRAIGMRALMFLLLTALGALQLAQAKDFTALERERIQLVFPEATAVSEPEGTYGVRTIHQGDELLGYAFQSIRVTDMPAYSGKPINLQIILDTTATIRDAYMLEHHEPIVLIGIPEQKIHAFNANYSGIKVRSEEHTSELQS